MSDISAGSWYKLLGFKKKGCEAGCNCNPKIQILARQNKFKLDCVHQFIIPCIKLDALRLPSMYVSSPLCRCPLGSACIQNNVVNCKPIADVFGWDLQKCVAIAARA